MTRSASVTIAVRPPPGRVVELELAVHRLDEAARDREPEPDAGCRSLVARPLERLEHAVALGTRAMPGPRSTMCSDTAAVDRAREHVHRCSPGTRVHRVVEQVGDHPFEQRGIRQHRRQRLGQIGVDTCAPPSPRLATAAGTTSSKPTARSCGSMHAGLQPAHVEQVRDERREPVGLLLDRFEELRGLRRRPTRRRPGAGSTPTP